MNLVGSVRNIQLAPDAGRRMRGQGRQQRRPVSRYFTPHQPPPSMPASASNEPRREGRDAGEPLADRAAEREGAAAAHQRAAGQMPPQVALGHEPLEPELAAPTGRGQRPHRGRCRRAAARREGTAGRARG